MYCQIQCSKRIFHVNFILQVPSVPCKSLQEPAKALHSHRSAMELSSSIVCTPENFNQNSKNTVEIDHRSSY